MSLCGVFGCLQIPSSLFLAFASCVASVWTTVAIVAVSLATAQPTPWPHGSCSQTSSARAIGTLGLATTHIAHDTVSVDHRADREILVLQKVFSPASVCSPRWSTWVIDISELAGNLAVRFFSPCLIFRELVFFVSLFPSALCHSFGPRIGKQAVDQSTPRTPVGRTCTMATARKSDQESLMALEALLKIRTENGGRTAARRSSSVTPTNAVGAAAPMPTSIGSGIAPVAGSVPGENQMPSSIQSTSGRSATLGLPPAAPNGNAATNMHTLVPAPYALQAMPPLQSMSTHSFETAAAAAAAAARGIFGTAATATHYNQTAANNSPPAPHPVQPITTGHLVQQHDSTAPLGGSQQPQPKKRRKSTSGRSSAAQSLVYKENNGVDKINSDQSNDDGTTTSKADIRQDQIEAALKSKPQRGRKRENLSVLERAELTRTRNREHAKSTRYAHSFRRGWQVVLFTWPLVSNRYTVVLSFFLLLAFPKRPLVETCVVLFSQVSPSSPSPSYFHRAGSERSSGTRNWSTRRSSSNYSRRITRCSINNAPTWQLWWTVCSRC